MHHAKFLPIFLSIWLSKITIQLPQAPIGIENFLFGGLGPLPPPSSQPIGMPIGAGNIFGQALPQGFGMSPGGGFGGPMSLPFPLFPMPCDPICDSGGLFFTNIMIQNPPPQMPIRPGGSSGSGGLGGGGSMGGGGGISGGGSMGSRPGGSSGSSGGMGGSSGRVTARPGSGSSGGMSGGMSGGGSGGGGSSGGSGFSSMGGGGMSGGGGLFTTTMRPNVNAQFVHIVPNWCTGWCRFFWRPPSMMAPPPPIPPMPAPSPFHRPLCLLYSWLGL